MKLSGKDLVVLFFCRQLQSVLLTMHPEQQLFFYIASLQQPGGNATPATAIQ